MKNYFAYGSNLNFKELKSSGFPERLLKEFKNLGTYLAPDRQLAFTYDSNSRGGGTLDIRPSKGAAVLGILFSVPDEAFEYFDKKEGHPSCYRRINLKAIDQSGLFKDAVSYEVHPENRRSFVTPTEKYVEIVQEGYKNFSLCDYDLNAAVRNKKHVGFNGCLFAYGTLMRFEQRNYAIADRRLTIMGSTSGVLTDEGSYPGLTIKQDSNRVWGELSLFKPENFPIEQLDEIEGFNGYDSDTNLYERTLVPVEIEPAKIWTAWCYVIKEPSEKVIFSGNWREVSGTEDTFIKFCKKKYLLDKRDEELLRARQINEKDLGLIRFKKIQGIFDRYDGPYYLN